MKVSANMWCPVCYEKLEVAVPRPEGAIADMWVAHTSEQCTPRLMKDIAGKLQSLIQEIQNISTTTRFAVDELVTIARTLQEKG